MTDEPTPTDLELEPDTASADQPAAERPVELEDQRRDLERLVALHERARTPARRAMLGRRISRLRKRIGQR